MLWPVRKLIKKPNYYCFLSSQIFGRMTFKVSSKWASDKTKKQLFMVGVICFFEIGFFSRVESSKFTDPNKKSSYAGTLPTGHMKIELWFLSNPNSVEALMSTEHQKSFVYMPGPNRQMGYRRYILSLGPFLFYIFSAADSFKDWNKSPL